MLFECCYLINNFNPIDFHCISDVHLDYIFIFFIIFIFLFRLLHLLLASFLLHSDLWCTFEDEDQKLLIEINKINKIRNKKVFYLYNSNIHDDVVMHHVNAILKINIFKMRFSIFIFSLIQTIWIDQMLILLFMMILELVISFEKEKSFPFLFLYFQILIQISFLIE